MDLTEKDNRVRIMAIASLIVASLFWSSAGVVTKSLYNDMQPIPLAFLRFSLSALFLLPFTVKKIAAIPRRIIFKKVLPTTFFMTGHVLSYYFGIKYTTVSAATILYTSLPLVTAIIFYLTGQERISNKKRWGIIIGFSGALLVTLLPTWMNSETAAFGSIPGNILIVLGVIMWSLYSIKSQKLFRDKIISPLPFTAVSFGVSSLILLLLTLPQTLVYVEVMLKNPKILLSTLYLSIFVTVLTFSLYHWAIEKTGALIASFNNYLQPAMTIILSVIFLREQFTFIYLVGIILIFAGLLYSSENTVGLILNKLKIRR